MNPNHNPNPNIDPNSQVDPNRKENRSSAFSPEQLAAVTQMTSAAVRETVAEIFKSLGPALAGMALTPEKIQALTKPYVDPAKEARSKREMLLWKQEEEARIKSEREAKDNCRHLDKRGQTSIRLIRNFPDRNPRGICMHCHDLIHPREWRIGTPDEKNPRGRAYLVDQHKDYMTVVHIAQSE